MKLASAAQGHAIPLTSNSSHPPGPSSLPQRISARFAENYLPPEHNGNSFERTKRSNAESSQAPAGKPRHPAYNPDSPTGKKKDRVFCCETVEPYLTNLESIASGRRLHRITNTRNLRNRGAALNMLKINDFRLPPSREHKNCFSVGMWRSSVWLTKRGSLLLAL